MRFSSNSCAPKLYRNKDKNVKSQSAKSAVVKKTKSSQEECSLVKCWRESRFGCSEQGDRPRPDRN